MATKNTAASTTADEKYAEKVQAVENTSEAEKAAETANKFFIFIMRLLFLIILFIIPLYTYLSQPHRKL